MPTQVCKWKKVLISLKMAHIIDVRANSEYFQIDIDAWERKIRHIRRTTDCTDWYECQSAYQFEERPKPGSMHDWHHSVNRDGVVWVCPPGRFRQVLQICQIWLRPTTDCSGTTAEICCIIEAEEVLYLGRWSRLFCSSDTAWQTGCVEGSNRKVCRLQQLTNMTETKSFLGLKNVFRSFVPNFTRIAALLNRKFEKGQQFCSDDWTYLKSRRSKHYSIDCCLFRCWNF